MSPKPSRLLAPDVLAGYERRAELGIAPRANLEEVVQLRAIIREMAAHIRAVESLLSKETPLV